MCKNPPQKSQYGNIFLALFGAVALAALLSYAVSQFIRGPLTTSTNLTRTNVARQQMTVAAQLVLATSATQTTGAGNGDCDSDNFIEPLEYRDGTTVPHPTGGGYLPSTVGATKLDPWGTEYGYCVWDAGSIITSDNNATCGGNTAKRLDGAKTTVAHPTKPNTQAIIAVISAGKDKSFQTTCNAFVDADDNAEADVTMVDKASGSDDIIVQYTYNEARDAGGDLWYLKSADPGTATIGKNVEIAAGQSLDFGLGSRLLIPTETELTNADCTGTAASQVNEGALRLNMSLDPPALEVCYDSDPAGGVQAWDWAAVAGGAGGALGIDDLSDGIADYTTLYNVFLGDSAGTATTTGTGNTALGYRALNTNIAKSGNTAIGYDAMRYADSGAAATTYNTALGYQALRGSTTAASNTGTNNTAVGYASLLANSTGSSNVAVGGTALYDTTIGGSNIGIGYRSLYSNKAGSGSTAIGNEAMYYANSSSTAFTSYNTAVGYQALRGSTTAASNTGTSNTSVGYQSLLSITAGTDNVAMGRSALYANLGGCCNIGIGNYALRWTSAGSSNVAVGHNTLFSNDIGNNNVAIGYEALNANTANNNVAIGYQALRTNTAKTGSTAIGYQAMRYADSGAAATTYNTAVGHQALMGSATASANTGIGNTAIGYTALDENTTGSNNVAIGRDSLRLNKVGSNNVAIGVNSLSNGGDYAFSGLVAVGYGALNSVYEAQANTAVGYNAGYTGQYGSYNSILGYEAAYTNNGNYNTVMGYNAMRQSSTAGYNTAFGANALRSSIWASRSTAVGNEAMYLMHGDGSTYDSNNTAVGYAAMRGSATAGNNTGTVNTAVGVSTLYSISSGLANTGIGVSSLYNVTTGNYNTAIGRSAGTNITTGSSNIMVGYNAAAPSATASNQLNIGNSLYGDVSAHQLNLGSSTLVSGISLDVGSKTDSIRPAVGTTAQEPTCDSTRIGAMRYDTTRGSMMVCTSNGWQPLLMTSGGSGTPSTPPAGTGYFVVTYGTWNGSLSGLSGANTQCLNDLKAYNWLNKSDAVSRGLLDASHVQAWLCDDTVCQNASASTTYTFAASGYSSTGGASFTSDSSGYLPGNTQNWSGSNYFGSARSYWTARAAGTSSLANGGLLWARCNNWTSSIASQWGGVGISNDTGTSRWAQSTPNCSTTQALVCMVHPGNESSVTTGYFVLTDTTYDGNLGGRSGANAKCLTELTTNTNWMGYTTANAAGQLTASKVFGFLCDGTLCTNTNANTTYQFAKVGDSSIGGATFTTNASGLGPIDNANWSGSTYFGGNYDVWTNRDSSGNSANWAASRRDSVNHCTNFTSNSSGGSAVIANTAYTDETRWTSSSYATCDQSKRLYCFVNP